MSSAAASATPGAGDAAGGAGGGGGSVLRRRSFFPHQEEAIIKLAMLARKGHGVVLGDEMGLGKTAVLLGTIYFLLEKHKFTDVLIVVPTTALLPWIEELAHFEALQCKVLVLEESVGQCERLLVENKSKKVGIRRTVILTSFSLLYHLSNRILTTQFHCLVVDEAHMIPARGSPRYKIFQDISAYFRVFASGTIYQNSAEQALDLFKLLMPSVFDNTETDKFSRWLTLLEDRRSTELGDYENDLGKIPENVLKFIYGQVSDAISPFCIIRTKADVQSAIKLLPLVEIMVVTPYSAAQRSISKLLESSGDDEDFDSAKDDGWNFSGKAAFQQMLQNKKKKTEGGIAHHAAKLKPAQCLGLVKGLDDGKSTFDDVSVSKVTGKMEALVALVTARPRRVGQKVLVYSNSVQVLDAIKQRLQEEKNIKLFFFDGRLYVNQRRQAVDKFERSIGTEETTCVFLLSTHAGGLGINLTSADTVILYDRDWNPQVDLQAMARAHRTGQTKPVVVYQLLAAHNEQEVKVLEFQNRKFETDKVFTLLMQNKPKEIKLRDVRGCREFVMQRRNLDTVDADEWAKTLPQFQALQTSLALGEEHNVPMQGRYYMILPKFGGEKFAEKASNAAKAAAAAAAEEAQEKSEEAFKAEEKLVAKDAVSVAEATRLLEEQTKEAKSQTEALIAEVRQEMGRARGGGGGGGGDSMDTD